MERERGSRERESQGDGVGEREIDGEKKEEERGAMGMCSYNIKKKANKKE